MHAKAILAQSSDDAEGDPIPNEITIVKSNGTTSESMIDMLILSS
jgi:hypothetical protein